MKDPQKTGPSGTDDRLKQLSDGYEVPFNDTAWEKMENLLDPQKPDRSPKFFTLKIIIAMIFFLSLIYFSFFSLNHPAPISGLAEETQENTLPTTTTPEKDTFTFSPPSTTKNSNSAAPPSISSSPKAAKKAPIIKSPQTLSTPIGVPPVLLPQTPLPLQVPPATKPAADSTFFRHLHTLLNERQAHFQPEKVYVHLDRPFFKPGENIWFTVYLRDALSFKPSRQSDIVYVELIAPNGKVAQKRSILASGGSGGGDFATTGSMAGGTYQIKAYTTWQENTETFFIRDLQIQKTTLPRLRMEFDFAREAYGPGDEVRAFLHLNSLDNKVLPNQEFSFYFNLDGEGHSKGSGKTDAQGQAQLTFKLPEVLESTDGLVNVMISHQGQVESISRSVPIVLNQVDLQFFPEGGNALAEMKGKVGFKAINELGEPADVEGVVLDENSNVVAAFKSYHMGMGAFDWQPEAGVKYTAKLTKPQGIPTNYDLPQVIKRGYTLEVLEQNEEAVLVQVMSTEEEALYLIAQSRDRIYESLVTPKAAGIHTLRIPTADMPIGIAQLTLFDSREIPRAERLVFLNPHKKLDITISTDKEKYLPREKVSLKIAVKDDRGLPVPGQFSLSVVDDNLLSYADDKQGHLFSHFLLESELQGRIKEPNFYFDPPKVDDGKDRALALNYLLMTQGWRRFDWVEIMGQQLVEMKAPAEKLQVSGLVLDSAGYAVEEGTEVSIPGTALRTTTDEEGFFTFSDAGFLAKHHHIKAAEGEVSGIMVHRSYEDYIYPASSMGSLRISQSVKGESKVIKGHAFDAATGEPLIFATVVEKSGRQNGKNGTNTNVDGDFSLKVEGDATVLEIAYIGYESKTVEVNLKEGYQTKIEVGLSEAKMVLQEVQLTAQKIAPRSIKKALSASRLEGKMAGVSKKRQKKKATKKRKETKLQAEKERVVMNSVEEQLGQGPVVENSDKEEVAAEMPAADDEVMDGDKGDIGKVLLDGVRRKQDDTLMIFDLTRSPEENQELLKDALADRLPAAPTNIKMPAYLYQTRTFYSPKYQQKEKVAQRSDFRSTIYWNPKVTIDRNGEGEVVFYNSDDISTFKTIIEGFGIEGSLGRSVHRHFTQLPFGMDLKLPTNVLTGDRLKLPLVLNNHTDQKIAGALQVRQLPEGFVLQNDLAQKISLDAGEQKTVYLDYTVDFKAQSGNLEIAFDANGFADAFSQYLEVTSRGFPIQDMYSGKVQETTFDIEITDPIAGSMEAVFTAYPSPLGDISTGLDRMLRQPTGCFEQTSSCNYPNLLVLDYLRAMKIKNPQLEKRALRLLKAGYQRLKSFEVDGGGFDWYGRAPAHEALTAYGLLQFVDMKKVYPVEEDLIERTAEWLLSRRDQKGGWQSSKRALHRWAGNDVIANTYIAWAMTEAGFGDKIKPEIEHAYRETVKSEDPYLMSLMLGILENTQDERADALRQELLALQEANGSWNGLSHSMTHSKGKSLLIETSALSILSVLKSGQNSPRLENAIQFIAGSKSANGFGSTQSTVLAMKALSGYAQANVADNADGKLTLYIDGKKIVDQAFSTKQQEDLVFPDLAKYFTPGKHRLRIRFDSKEAVLPYDLALHYFTNQPRNTYQPFVTLKTELQNTEVGMGNTVRLISTIKNASADAVPNTIAMIGIPAGLSVQPWQLKELKQKGLCDYIELYDGYVVFHFLGLEKGAIQTIDLDLKATIPGAYEAPASVAYLYYQDENKYWTKPAVVRVAE